MLCRWKEGGTSALILAVDLSAGGCASSNDKLPSSANAPADRVDSPTAGTVERPSNLSYGTVTATVKKNVTTQMDLVNLFGGPNISTTDADGAETWVYERTASTTDTAGSADQKQFAAFFGAGAQIGSATLGGGAAGGTAKQNDQRRTVNSVRTLTVVVKFNPDKTVKDYSARASYF
jgi:hypothetical protein